MTEVISRISLEKFNQPMTSDERKDVLLNDKFRVRLLQNNQVPIISNLSSTPSDVIVIDLPQPVKSSEPKPEPSDDYDVSMDSDESYVDDGTGPLVFHFLTLKKLEKKQAKIPHRRAFGGGFEFFDCNPIPSNLAIDMPYTLLHSAAPSLDSSLLSLPIIVICDASDAMRTSFVSMHVQKNSTISTHTRFLGRYGDKCDATLHSLLSRFPKKMDRRSKATAVYKILSSDLHGDWAKKAVLAEMYFTFKWSQDVTECSYLLPPSPSAVCKLHISPGWMDMRIQLRENTMQLEHILALSQALTVPNFAMPWPSCAEKDATVVPRVAELIDKCKGIQRKTNDRFLDFTEELWDILRDCASCESVLAGLQLVFDALRKCKINTILHNDNKSWLARLVRDSLSGDLRLPRLEALTPIQILLEIGIERFRRDMLHRFVSEKLATSESEIVGWLEGADSAPEVRARALVHVHLALQTMLEIKEKLTITPHQISNMTRSVLMKFCSNPDYDLSKVFFETEVALVNVNANIMKDAEPWLWVNETSYVSKGANAVTTTQLCKSMEYEHLHNKLPVLISQCAENSSDARDPRESYVCSITTRTIMPKTKN